APDRIPAASCGSMNNVALGSTAGPRPFAYYETIAGGAGGGAAGAGGAGGPSPHTENTNNPHPAPRGAYPPPPARADARAAFGWPRPPPGWWRRDPRDRVPRRRRGDATRRAAPYTTLRPRGGEARGAGSRLAGAGYTAPPAAREDDATRAAR